LLKHQEDTFQVIPEYYSLVQQLLLWGWT